MEALRENILVSPLTGKGMEREGIIGNGHTSVLRVSKYDTSVDPAGSSLRDLCPRKPRQMQSYFPKMELIGLTCVSLQSPLCVRERHFDALQGHTHLKGSTQLQSQEYEISGVALIAVHLTPKEDGYRFLRGLGPSVISGSL